MYESWEEEQLDCTDKDSENAEEESIPEDAGKLSRNRTRNKINHGSTKGWKPPPPQSQPKNFPSQHPH